MIANKKLQDLLLDIVSNSNKIDDKNIDIDLTKIVSISDFFEFLVACGYSEAEFYGYDHDLSYDFDISGYLKESDPDYFKKCRLAYLKAEVARLEMEINED